MKRAEMGPNLNVPFSARHNDLLTRLVDIASDNAERRVTKCEFVRDLVVRAARKEGLRE